MGDDEGRTGSLPGAAHVIMVVPQMPSTSISARLTPVISA